MTHNIQKCQSLQVLELNNLSILSLSPPSLSPPPLIQSGRVSEEVCPPCLFLEPSGFAQRSQGLWSSGEQKLSVPSLFTAISASIQTDPAPSLSQTEWLSPGLERGKFTVWVVVSPGGRQGESGALHKPPKAKKYLAPRMNKLCTLQLQFQLRPFSPNYSTITICQKGKGKKECSLPSFPLPI